MTKKNYDDVEIPLREHITYPLARLNAKLTAQATRLLKKHTTLSLSQWRLIVYLGSAGEAKLAEFVRMSGFDKGQMSRISAGLIDQGLIQSKVAHDDGRAQLLSLTAKGQDVYQTALPHMRKRREFLIEVLSESERKTYFELMEKIEQAAETFEQNN